MILPANNLQEDTALVTLPAEMAKMLESFQYNRSHMLDGNDSWLKEMK